MKFIADENIDKPIVETLRKSGYIAFYILGPHTNYLSGNLPPNLAHPYRSTKPQ